ncbi:TPA: Rha family transcriptional regulator, partial [Shigella flexneri]|nr:Rha family transcriptional regulator [Shigella flexneri]EFV9820349.1 Rha family transcriptional regulator [Shigella flexneri]
MSQQEISIINLDQLVSMTSVEIAELTGKEHKHVLRDIRNMVEELNGAKTEHCSTLSS